VTKEIVDVKMFELVDGYEPYMSEVDDEDDAEWVEFEDYKQLREENERLKSENERLLEALAGERLSPYYCPECKEPQDHEC